MIAWIKTAWAAVRASSWMLSALKVVALVAGVLAIGALVLSMAKNAGRNEVLIEQKDKALDHVKERKDVEDSVRREPDPAGRLRNEWNRDKRM